MVLKRKIVKWQTETGPISNPLCQDVFKKTIDPGPAYSSYLPKNLIACFLFNIIHFISQNTTNLLNSGELKIVKKGKKTKQKIKLVV